MVPLLVLVVGTAATLAATTVVHGVERERLTTLRERRTEQIGATVERELSRYADLALVSRGLYEGSEQVSPPELDRFVDNVDLAARYPGASTIAFVVPTDDAGMAEVERLTAGAGTADLDQVAVPEGTHFVIAAARRADRTAPELGRDLAVAPEPERAMRWARDRGTPVLSETYVLLRDRSLPVAQQQRSAALVAPVYRGGGTPASLDERRQRLRGWVYVSFRGSEFLRDILGQGDEALDVELLDGPSYADHPDAEAVVARLPARMGAAAGPALPAEVAPIKVAGRGWIVRVTPHAAQATTDSSVAADVTLGGGLALSALLAGTVAALAASRGRALRHVDQATTSLRQANIALAARGDELAHAALHDPLTGLPNRALLMDRLQQTVAHCRRSGRPGAVLFVDLDGFKLVNDTLGHHVGDAVLVAVAERLRGELRPVDTVARLGGDEFVIVCADAPAAEAARILDRLERALLLPLATSEGAVSIGASIGLRPVTADADAEEILQGADAAMYDVKRRRTSGRGAVLVTP